MSTGPAPDPATAGAALQRWPELPLFPLQAVLFPGGLLHLKVFEARYLDLMSHCLRSRQPFAVVSLRQGSEVGSGVGSTSFEDIAVLAHLQEVDAEQAGILRVRCVGGQRVHLGRSRSRDDGLWLAPAQALPDDSPCPVPPALAQAARALGLAIDSLAAQQQHPFLTPHRLDDAGWVANRWCEILPISVAAKYRLMALDEPGLRLRLVDEFLRGKGVI